MDTFAPEDRRRAPRHAVTFRVVFDHGGTYCAGTVVDVSATGVRVRVAQQVPLQANVSLVPVGAAGELLFDVPATVVRLIPIEEDGWDLGLEFGTLDARRLEALNRIFGAMPATDFDQITAGRPKPSPGEPREPREPPHHRIRARLRPTLGKSPRWARKPL